MFSTYRKELSSSRQTYNINVEFNLNEFSLQNTYLKLSFSMYVHF